MGGAGGQDEGKQPQPWYFHVVASLILVVHGFTFLVPSDPESEDTDMVRTVAKWFGYECEWVKIFTPYAQVSVCDPSFRMRVLATTASLKGSSGISP